MLRQITPRLGRNNVMLNSFGSGISNASKEFSRTPEMSFSKVVPQPGMFLQQHKRRVALKQLKGFADTRCDWHFNKQVNVVNSDMQFINFEPMLVSNFSDKKLTIHPNPIKLHRVFSVFTFPDKVESILSEAMFKTFQIHFLTPKSDRTNTAHANFDNLVREGSIYPLYINNLTELNLVEEGNSSLGFKAEVPLPLM